MLEIEVTLTFYHSIGTNLIFWAAIGLRYEFLMEIISKTTFLSLSHVQENRTVSGQNKIY